MIKISVVSYNNEASQQPLSGIFGRHGGTLGRDEDNHFVLPDPKRFVSRKQALISSNGARHTIANLSRASPILINGREIDFGREYDLKTGDEIRIGLYVLCAEPLPVSADEYSASINDRGALMAVNPLQPHQGTAPIAASNTPSHPKSDPAKPHAHAPAPGISKSEPAARKSHVPEQQMPSIAPDTDQAPAMNANAADNQALVDAFLAGAGIPQISLPSGLTPELMEMIGKLLATTIQGTFELVASRALIKREVKADMTMVVVRNNNPLKFLPDGQTILIQMLRKKMPGFMAPVEAMEDAYEDLHAHQNGMVAGMHATVTEMLERFNPRQFEQQLQEHSILDALSPMPRKAKMWDMYNVQFQTIHQESQDDFQVPLGKAFLGAYEKEIERLKNEAFDD
jgi:FHA domain-containing protein